MKSLPINYRPIGAIHDHLINGMKDSIQLYRSASIEKMIDDVPTLQTNLGVTCFLDLRNSDEINSDITAKLGLSYHHFNMVDPEQLIRNSINGNYLIYGQSYINLVLHNAENIVKLLKFLIVTKHQRFVISCYAGKDRTGIMSAIILLLFDMPLWLIHADYVMSTAYLLPHIAAFEENWRKRHIEQAVYQNRFKIDPRALQYFFDYFDHHHHGLLVYLQQHGLNNTDIILFNKKFKAHKSILLQPFIKEQL